MASLHNKVKKKKSLPQKAKHYINEEIVIIFPIFSWN